MSFDQVQERGRQFLDLNGTRRARWWNNLSAATIFATSLFAKAFLHGMMKSVEVENLDILREAYRQSKLENRGLVTYMNHMSLLDDPFIWGTLPIYYSLSPDRIRWGLGADNVCFGSK